MKTANDNGIRSVCVFCGAARGKDPAFAEALADLARGMAARDMTLVNGGGGVGLMGVTADAMLAAGGRAIGIIPERLLHLEVGHKGMTELRVVKSMHERKALMSELSDAFVAAPGGIGTLEELFEVFTWKQIGYHDKPVVLLNTGGYYEPLIRFLEHGVGAGLIQPQVHAQLRVFATPAEVLDHLGGVGRPKIDFGLHEDAT